MIRAGRVWRAIVVLLVSAAALAATAAPAVVVGSKRFTESYVLGEIVRQTYADAGIAAEHRQGLGNTGILVQALTSGAIDIYPEYTGTIVRELLHREGTPGLDEINALLAPRGLKAGVPLGFNNTYALAMREADAERLHLTTISDLLAPPARGLRLGLSHEFLARADGWPALTRAYGLPFAPPSGLDHGLAYAAMADGRIDVMDVYSTDAQIAGLKLRVLRDDRAFFPKYEAVLLMRSGVDTSALQRLTGRIDERRMVALNAQAELQHMAFADIARGFVASLDGGKTGAEANAAGAPSRADAPDTVQGFWSRLWAPDLPRLAVQHLLLVFGSLALAVLAGVPLGIWAWQRPRAAQWVLGAVGVLQTIPSLALLAFLIAVMGSIGVLPAVVALFLYALLPIVRNSHAGLSATPPSLAQAGLALGLTRGQLLRAVQLPLALPLILAGAKTAAIINVGTATMAAFIGAGGFGERIVAGLALNDHAALLAGAVPAAAMALLVQGAFEWVERRAVAGPRAAPSSTA